MKEYLIVMTYRRYDDWIAGYCPAEGAYYRILKKVPVQTDFFKENADEWEQVDYFYDNNSFTPTTETKRKLAVTLVSAGFGLDDMLAIVEMESLYSLNRNPSIEIPQYSEQNKIGSLQEQIKKIIAGGINK